MLEIRKETGDTQAASIRAYDRLHEEGSTLQQLDSFYLWVLRLLSPRAGASLLDVSCGGGSLIRFAHRASLGTYGIDISTAALRRARDLSPLSGVVAGDGEALPFPARSFDYVTCIGSLEHFPHPMRGVQEMARVLKQGGTACVLVPNTYSLLGNIKYVWHTGDIFDDGQPLQRYGTHTAWQKLLEGSGLLVWKVAKYEREFPRTLKDFGWYLRRLPKPSTCYFHHSSP